jgi:hypothetical protein
MKTTSLLADVSSENPIRGLGRFLPEVYDGSGGSAVEPEMAFFQINQLFTTVLGFLTIVGGLAFLVYFLVGALNWITGGDDKSKVDTAKKYMTNGAIGLIIIIASYSVAWIVGQVLGFDLLNPASLLRGLTGRN